MINKQYQNGQVFSSDIKDLIPYLLENNIRSDLIITDPPYRIIGGGCTKQFHTSGIFDSSKKEGKSGKLFKYNDIKFNEWVSLLYEILKDNSHCYIYSNDKNLNSILNECLKVGFKLHTIITWVKNSNMPTLYYMKKTEFILFLRKGSAKRINNLGTKNIFIENYVKNKLHPTQKPIEQLQTMISNSSNENDLILDPFSGSGSLAIAAINTKRKFIISDIDIKYYDISNDRIKKHLNNKVIHKNNKGK